MSGGSPAQRGELPAGTRIGRYVVAGWRGADSLGVVYAAHDPELNRRVALRVLHPDGDDGCGRTRHRWLREAQAMAQLAHPNVVTIYDVGSAEDQVFIAMDLVDGPTLTRWLCDERRTWRAIVGVFLAAGRGLAAAHAAGLVHGDFTPDHVLVGDDGRVCVADFGLARAGAAGSVSIAPCERVEAGDATGAHADQLRFATALCDALEGSRRAAIAPLDELASRSTRAVRSSSAMPVALRRVLRRAVCRGPDDRYASMDALLDAIAATLATQAPARRGRWAASAAIALSAVAVVIAVVHVNDLRRVRAARADLVGRLRGLASEIPTLLRNAHMLPLHDIRAEREAVRGLMREVAALLSTAAGQSEIALGQFVLGEGHRALGDQVRALAAFETAWAGGERGAQMDAALGYALGAAHESRLIRIEQTVPSADRAAQVRELERRYRDPALAHLRAALVSGSGAPAYLEALIAFHEHRFADASRFAQAVFAESPTFAEAGALAARARNEHGRQLMAVGDVAAATLELTAARQIFERVLQVARSDDEAWVHFGEMVYAQAILLSHGGPMPPELQQQAITALRNAQRINPDNGTAYLREAHIALGQGNIEIIWFRDPESSVERALELAELARQRHADAVEVALDVCTAHWERGVHQGRHGVDPRASFDAAVAACRTAATASPDVESYDMLGVLHGGMATYESQHGVDPARNVQLADDDFRAVLAIFDEANTHYNRARLWSVLAHYDVTHGRDPEHAVETSVAEYETVLRMTVTRADAWAGMSDTLAALAQFRLQRHQDAQPVLARARQAYERALGMEPGFVVAMKRRLEIAALDADDRLARGVDPTVAVDQTRAYAEAVLTRLPADSSALLRRCDAELVAARWAIAHRAPAVHLLARAEREAAQARADDPGEPLAWAASAEVEQVRAEAARARGVSPDAAGLARGLSFVERAMAIDPTLVRTLAVRDALTP